jgi:hypothetical protein
MPTRGTLARGKDLVPLAAATGLLAIFGAVILLLPSSQSEIRFDTVRISECNGGGQADFVAVPSLDALIATSDLVIRGKVVSCLRGTTLHEVLVLSTNGGSAALACGTSITSSYERPSGLASTSFTPPVCTSLRGR